MTVETLWWLFSTTLMLGDFSFNVLIAVRIDKHRTLVRTASLLATDWHQRRICIYQQTIYWSPGWHHRTERRVASHTVIIVLCTKLDAACDRQVTVVSQMLTTLSYDQHAIMKLFLVQMLGKAPEEITIILEILKCRICLINILQLQGAWPLDQKLWIKWRYDPGTYQLARSPMHAMTV